MKPTILGEDLNDRHNQFLREVRQAIKNGIVDEQSTIDARAKIRAAQESYSAWFDERGVTMVFKEEL